MNSTAQQPAAGASRFRVVHTAAGFARDWHLEREALAAIGAHFEPVNAESEEELINACRTADAIIVVRERFTRRVIEALERARVIVRSGVGYDVIDVPAATARGIAVCTIPDYCTQEVANHALALLLAVNRRLRELDAAVRAGHWRGGDLPSIGPLYGQTVGIVGYGRIGRAMAARCRALGMRVLAADPYTGPPDADDRIVPLDELLADADYVSIHCLLNDETRGLIDERALRWMKPTAILVNTARGPIVDQRALTRALQEGWIAGAGLDVLEREPPNPHDPLLSLPNVVFTPHTAYYSDLSAVRLRQRVVQEVVCALTGGRPPGLLNPEVWKER
ncbi:MAG: hydroxyacid dehydrogenase [Chloroflexota bacterium]